MSTIETAKPQTWEPTVITPSNPQRVLPRDLVEGRVPILVLRDFLPDALLDNANRAIDEHRGEVEIKQFTNGRLTTVGPWLMKYLRTNMDGYYARAGTVERVLGSHGAAGLPGTVRDALCRVLGFSSLTVPVDAHGRRYAPAVIRIHSAGIDNPLHNDKVGRDTHDLPDIVLRDIDCQLSAVVGLQECAAGTGVLRIWRKRWQPEDEVHKRPGALGYFDQVVEGVPFLDYQPVRGDIYVFFPEMYHAISRVGDGPDRRTLGQFIGLRSVDSTDAVCWA